MQKFSDLLNNKKRQEVLKNLSDLIGIGDTQIKSIDDFFSNKKNTQIIHSLIEVLNIKDFEKIVKSESLVTKI